MAEGGSYREIIQNNYEGGSDNYEGFGESSLESDYHKTPAVSTALPEMVSAKNKEIHLVLAGKSGAGKSTLARIVFEIDASKPSELTPDHDTTECKTSRKTMHGITILCTDTVGLEERKGKNKELRSLSRHLKGNKVHLLVYCISVNPASKFRDTNPSIMKSLHYTFGSKIWNHCILVLTFSNDARKWHDENIEENERASKYEDYIMKYAEKFREELQKLKVRKVSVKAIFDLQSEPMQASPIPDETTTTQVDDEKKALTTDDQPEPKTDSTQIVAIPAGNKPNDLTLSRFKPRNCIIEVDGQRKEFFVRDWRDVIFIEIIRKCNDEVKKSLLRYRYGHEVHKALTQGATSGTLVGAGVGAAAGTALGIPGGPIGMAIGAAVGTVVGCAAGAATGSTIVIKKRQKK